MAQTGNVYADAPISSSIWSAEGRIGRASYFWVTLITMILFMPLEKALELTSRDSLGSFVAVLPFAIALIYFGTVAAIKRLHDLGKSGWFALLWFAPLANLGLGLYLLFWPGQAAADAKRAFAQGGLAQPAAEGPAGAGETDFTTTEPMTGPEPAVARAAPSAGSQSQDDDLWSAALSEFEGDARQRGLWARSFAEARGDEAVAKAAYLTERVAQMRRARNGASAPMEPQPETTSSGAAPSQRRWVEPDPSDPQVAASMATLGVTSVNDTFRFRDFTYDKLSDALAYAESLSQPAAPIRQPQIEPDPSESKVAERMKTLGVTQVDGQFWFGDYRYDKLSDALAFAEKTVS